jgi:hypothetical protein
VSAFTAHTQAYRMSLAQERLERDGWRFYVHYLAGVDKFSVFVQKRTFGLCETFVRADRADALAHALQFAELENAMVAEAAQ